VAVIYSTARAGVMALTALAAADGDNEGDTRNRGLLG
jgi:hypothetical protein